jgi:hypothetical protein
MAKVKTPTTISNKKKLIDRTIYYYELQIEEDLLFTSNENYSIGMNSLEVLAHTLIDFVKPDNNDRFFVNNEKNYLIKNIRVDSNRNRIQGELLLVRKDNFPEVMNMLNDKIKSIDTDDDDGVAEKTHFVIEYRKGRSIILAMEHNQFGAKFTDLCQYLTRVGILFYITKSIKAVPIIKNTLNATQKRIGKVSKISVRIHNDNLYKVRSLNTGFFSALKATEKCFKNDYSEINISYEYRNRQTINEGENLITKAISFLTKERENLYVFDKFTVKAEDSQINNKLGDFDLLMDRIYSSIKVLKKEREKNIISEDMFEKIHLQLNTMQL